MWIMKGKQETVQIRIYKSTWALLKVIAAKRGISLIKLLEQISHDTKSK